MLGTAKEAFGGHSVVVAWTAVSDFGGAGVDDVGLAVVVRLVRAGSAITCINDGF